MAYVIETPNPFQPLTDVKKHRVADRVTIRKWLEDTYPGFIEFEVPTICLLNGQPVLRSEWATREMAGEDVVNFISMPQGVFLVVAAIIVAVIALSVFLVRAMNQPLTPGETPGSDPVFSTKGQQNTIRLGEPIEVCYGRNRIYPALAARPYFQYIDNDQFQYSLFCLGQGEFDIEEIMIGDTPIDQFQEVQWEVIPPGDTLTLFPDSVYTSVEAGGQTLFAPNEEEYVAPGYVGPFPANPSGTMTTQLQVDLNYGKGIYVTNSDGGLDSKTIDVEIDYREIDDAGAPIGVFLPFTSPYPYSITAATTTPQRKTVRLTLPAGRYEIRMRRTDTKDTSFRAGHDVMWEGMRSYVNGTIDFGDVTLLAVIIRATNNLNERTQLKFNAIATRKLPIRESGGTWSDPIATRSIIWAFVDVFKSRYGGRVFDDDFFDWDAIEELDALYTDRGEYFDWILRDPITVWEAAKAVLQVGRAVPLISGSLISLRRDGPLDIPVTMFSPDNIVDKSLEWNVKLWDVDEYDSIRVEYTEPNTGYTQQTVLCILPGGTGDHPQDVRLAGCQDRSHAYREGLFMLAVAKYQRENIVFETGLEGYIPTFGDLVAVVHDVPRWGQSGYIVHAARGAGDQWILYVSEPLIWENSGDYQVMLRGRKSEIIGPLDAQQMDDAQQILVTVPEETDGGFDFLLGGQSEPMLFVFGVSSQITKYCKVVRIEPQGNEAIRMTCVNDAPLIHSFDDLVPPALSLPDIPPAPPDAPSIGSMTITQIDGVLQIIQISWTAAFGAQYYIVQTSEDGTFWQERASTIRTSLQIQVRPGALWVRVAAVNNGQGPWLSEIFSVKTLNGLIDSTPWNNGTQWGISWWSVLNAIGYVVRVYDGTNTDPILKRTESVGLVQSYTYDLSKAEADGNITRDMLVSVSPVFEEGESDTPAELELFNAIPSPVLTASVETFTVNPSDIVYRVSWVIPFQDDLIGLKVWAEPTTGFDPEVEIPVIDELASEPGSTGMPNEAFVTIPTTAGAHPAYYVRVGVFDVWGEEISTNLTGELVIAAVL